MPSFMVEERAGMAICDTPAGKADAAGAAATAGAGAAAGANRVPNREQRVSKPVVSQKASGEPDIRDCIISTEPCDGLFLDVVHPRDCFGAARRGKQNAR